MFVNILYQFIRNLKLLCCIEQFVLCHRTNPADFSLHHSHMPYSLNNISCTGFALCADHRRPLIDTAQCFPKIFGTANKGYVKLGFVNVVFIICRGENLRLINVINLNRLKDLRFGKVADTAFRHNGNRHSFLYPFNHFGIAHTGYAACRTDIRRDSFQSHNSTGTRRFCNLGLFRGGNVHNNAAL